MLSRGSERCKDRRFKKVGSLSEPDIFDTLQLPNGHDRAQPIQRGSRARSIETCETHAPGDSMTKVWRVPLVRTVSKAVMVALSTFASIRPFTFWPETWPPWRYWLSNQLPESAVPL